MIDLTHDKTYRFLILLFLAVIAMSLVLVVVELEAANLSGATMPDGTIHD